MRNNVFIGLVHYPVYNKNSDVVSTSVTNFDIHDISRSSKTYGLKGYYIITPVKSQEEITKNIIGFWNTNAGSDYNIDRTNAFSNTYIKDSIKNAIIDIENMTEKKVKIITTSAKKNKKNITFSEMSDIIYKEDYAYFILLGTGWGLTDEILDESDYILAPIRPNSEYNHLSVRSAAAIIMDRLFGDN